MLAGERQGPSWISGFTITPRCFLVCGQQPNRFGHFVPPNRYVSRRVGFSGFHSWHIPVNPLLADANDAGHIFSPYRGLHIVPWLRTLREHEFTMPDISRMNHPFPLP